MNLKKQIIFLTLIVALVGWSSCGDDIQLPNQILSGEINGNEWTFEVGKSSSNQLEMDHEIELYNFTGFADTDGCQLFPGNSPHLTFSIPFSARNGQQLDAIVSNLVFHQDGNNALTADRGTIEVSFINEREIRGFIFAGSSTDNSVEGFFSVLICN